MENLKHLSSLPTNSTFANSMNSTFAIIIRLRVTRTSRWLCGCLRSTENREKKIIDLSCMLLHLHKARTHNKASKVFFEVLP